MNNQAKGALALLAVMYCSSVPATNFYVAYPDPADVRSSDSFNGLSINTPFKTVQKGVNEAAKDAKNKAGGNTVFIRTGTYREDIEVTAGLGGGPGNPVNIFAYDPPNADPEKPVIKGSNIVSGWIQHSGPIWKKPWSINSQQVFVDLDKFEQGVTSVAPWLQQIGYPHSTIDFSVDSPGGTVRPYLPVPLKPDDPRGLDPNVPDRALYAVNDMSAGSFFFEPNGEPVIINGAPSYPNGILYVWLRDGSNPNINHIVEASTRLRNFFVHTTTVNPRGYFHLKGLTFRHSNNNAQVKQGAAVSLSNNSIIEDCDIQWTDFGGLTLREINAQAINCVIANNGDVGVSGSGPNFRITGSTIVRNNYRSFNPNWSTGGIKMTGTAYGVIEDNQVGWNNGSGIWFDVGSGNTNPKTIRKNYVHDNRLSPDGLAKGLSGPQAAIFFEISNNGLIYNNVVVDNEIRGIYLSASNDSRIFNNTIIRTGGRASIEVGGVPRLGRNGVPDHTLKNNQVFNNIIFSNAAAANNASYDLFMIPDNGTDAMGNSSNYNNFYRTAGTIQLLSRGRPVYTNLSSWHATGWDSNSMSLDPNFSTPITADKYLIPGNSPVVNAGIAVPGVLDDYRGVSRPQGGVFDIGAYEFSASALIPNPQSAPPSSAPPLSLTLTPSPSGASVQTSTQSAGSGGGGGCSLDSNATPDPILPLWLSIAGLYLLRRRQLRQN